MGHARALGAVRYCSISVLSVTHVTDPASVGFFMTGADMGSAAPRNAVGPLHVSRPRSEACDPRYPGEVLAPPQKNATPEIKHRNQTQNSAGSVPARRFPVVDFVTSHMLRMRRAVSASDAAVADPALALQCPFSWLQRLCCAMCKAEPAFAATRSVVSLGVLLGSAVVHLVRTVLRMPYHCPVLRTETLLPGYGRVRELCRPSEASCPHPQPADVGARSVDDHSTQAPFRYYYYTLCDAWYWHAPRAVRASIRAYAVSVVALLGVVGVNDPVAAHIDRVRVVSETHKAFADTRNGGREEGRRQQVAHPLASLLCGLWN